MQLSVRKGEEQKNEEFVVRIPERAVGLTAGRSANPAPEASPLCFHHRTSSDLGQKYHRKNSSVHKSSISSASPSESKSLSHSAQQIIGISMLLSHFNHFHFFQFYLYETHYSENHFLEIYFHEFIFLKKIGAIFQNSNTKIINLPW